MVSDRNTHTSSNRDSWPAHRLWPIRFHGQYYLSSCVPRHFSCTIQGIIPAANTGESPNTGEHLRECEPFRSRVGEKRRAGCEKHVCRSCFFVTYRARQDPSSHTQGLTAIVAAAWPLRGQRPTVAAARGKAWTRSRGTPLRGAATFLPVHVFICCFVIFSFSSSPRVILLQDAQG